jgi:hypothetical protein
MKDMTEETTIQKTPIETNGRGLVLRNIEDMWRYAEYVVASKLAPASFKEPAQILVAIQTGAELGIPPMRALQSLCVINGQARLYGDAPLALVKQSGLMEYIREFIEGEPGQEIAICVVKRKDEPDEVERTFSVDDAKCAGLWGKVGKTTGKPTPWVTFPKRMLQMRARSLALRDVFPDCFGGATIAEEYYGVPEPSHESDTPRRGERKAVESKQVDEPKTDEQVLETCRAGVRAEFEEKFQGEDWDRFAQRIAEGDDTLEQLQKIHHAIKSLDSVEATEAVSPEEAEQTAKDKFGTDEEVSQAQEKVNNAVEDVKKHRKKSQKKKAAEQKKALKNAPPPTTEDYDPTAPRYKCDACSHEWTPDEVPNMQDGKFQCAKCLRFEAILENI